MSAAFFLLVALGGGASPAQTAKIYGYDLQGIAVTQLTDNRSGASTRPVVLIFLATDCPISNRYVPEIKRLQKEFAADGVNFWLVYPNAGETAQGVKRHQAAFGLEELANHEHVLLRPSSMLFRMANAVLTPEAVVLVSNGQALHAVYKGRIDDRYLDIGRERPQATRHDLEQAISAVLHGKQVTPADGPPVGCGIISPAMLAKKE